MVCTVCNFTLFKNWLKHIFVLTAYVWEAAPCSTLPSADENAMTESAVTTVSSSLFQSATVLLSGILKPQQIVSHNGLNGLSPNNPASPPAINILLRFDGQAYLCCKCMITATAPSYLWDLPQLYTPFHTLRSASDILSLQIPYTRLSSVGSCAFSGFRPSAWNNPPLPLRQKLSLDSFKCNLKTFIFFKTVALPCFSNDKYYLFI